MVSDNNPQFFRYPKGSLILREGDSTQHNMFFIMEGSAVILRGYNTHREEVVTTLLPGDFFGEDCLFLGIASTMTMQASTEVVALVINSQNVLPYFSMNPNKAYDIIRRLCGKISVMNKTVSDLSEKIQASAVVAPAIPQSPMAPAKPLLSAPKPKADPAKDVTAVQAPTPAQDEPTIQLKTALFPEGHGMDYQLNIVTNNKEYISPREMNCPLCQNRFPYLKIRAPKLRVDRTDDDLRVHYKDIEPMYYDILTCPKCLYSALVDVFPSAMASRRKRVADIVEPYKADLGGLPFGRDFITQSVFASYYLALLCAPICFSDPELIVAGLWLKLSRIYNDCEDAAMETHAANQAKDAYMNAFSRLNISPSKAPQLYLTIGAISAKLGDVANAKNFLYKAKTDKQSSPVIKEKADILIDDIRAR